MTCRGQILTQLQQKLDAAENELAAAVVQQVPKHSAVVVVDGAGREMPGTVTAHGSGSQAGTVCVLPLKHKYPEHHKYHRRSLRWVHWTQLDLEGADDD